MSKHVNYNENLVAGAAIRDDKGRRISKLFEASHPKMTVGYAKNLIMPDTPTEQEFNFRQAGDGVIEDGVAVIDKVKGNSVVWNQMVRTKGTDYTVEFTLDYQYYEFQNQPGVVGHKYCVGAEMKSSNGATVWFGITPGNYNYGVTCETTSTSFVSVASIGVCQEYESQIPTIRVYGMKGGGITIKDNSAFVIDLTQMFGAGNEPSTYEEFLRRKPKVADEYAYNEGTIVNNKVESIEVGGRNIFKDDNWELGYYDSTNGLKVNHPTAVRSKDLMSILPSTDYYFKTSLAGNMVALFYWDANGNYIGGRDINLNNVFTTMAGAYYMAWHFFGATSVAPESTCINLSDPAINGQYFPYEKHELDLSWIKEIKDAEGVKLFEDGMKSAGTAFDEVGKNKAVKRLGVKVFNGTEGWTYRTADATPHFDIKIVGQKATGSYSTLASMVASNYNNAIWSEIFSKVGKYGYICHGNDTIGISDSSYTNIDSWKAHLADLYAQGNPLVVIYELAEPIEVEYDEKSLTYPVVAGGTEEAIASEPSTAFRADIGYGIDAVKTILDLKARVEALEAK